MKSNAFLGALTKATLLLLALLTAVLGAHAQSWTNFYDGPDHSHDEVVAIAVDRNGNVAVTGYSVDIGFVPDYATIKYSSAGVPLWTNRYNGPANAGDLPYAVALDTNGNVFVTGGSRSPGEGSNFDLTTIMYSSAGVPMWTNRYDGPAHSEDGGKALAVDSSGNVIVSGYTSTGPDFFSPIDFVAIKYSNAGLPLWTNRFGPVASGYGSRCRIMVDRQDNAIMTGNIYRNDGMHYGTVKYSGAGVALWTNIYDQARTSGELPAGLALDANGNVFVTGSTYHGDGDWNWATIAYSNGGVPLWTNHFSRSGTSQDIPAGVAVDRNGNVFVAGLTYGDFADPASESMYATIKYANNGVPLWTNFYNGPGTSDGAQAVVVDGNGNVFVTGASLSTNIVSYDAIVYSNEGAALWTNSLSGGSFISHYTYGVCSAMDAAGNLFVATSLEGPGSGRDYATVKYAALSSPPSLNIQRMADSIVLSWADSAFRLQASATVTGAFTNIPGAISPYTSPASATQRYFRLAN